MYRICSHRFHNTAFLDEDVKYFSSVSPLEKRSTLECWLTGHGFPDDLYAKFVASGISELPDALFCKDADLLEIYPGMLKGDRIRFRRLATDDHSKLTLPTTIPTGELYDGSKRNFDSFVRFIYGHLARYVDLNMRELGITIISGESLTKLQELFLVRLIHGNVSEEVSRLLSEYTGIRIFIALFSVYGRKTTTDLVNTITEIIQPAPLTTSTEAVDWLNRTVQNVEAIQINGKMLALSGLLQTISSSSKLEYLKDKLGRIPAEKIEEKWDKILLLTQSAFDMQDDAETGGGEDYCEVNEVGEKVTEFLVDSGAKFHCTNEKSLAKDFKSHSKPITAYGGSKLKVDSVGRVNVSPVGAPDVTLSLAKTHLIRQGTSNLLAPLELLQQRHQVQSILLSLQKSNILLKSGTKIPLTLKPGKGWYLSVTETSA